MDMQSTVRCIPGIGEKLEKKLNKLGLFSVADCLTNLPRRYRDLGEVKTISGLKISEEALLRLKVLTDPKTAYIKRNFSRTTFEAGDGTGILTVVLFNQNFTVQKITAGTEVFVYGRMDLKFRRMQLASPEIFFEYPGQILPVYTLTRGVTQAFLRKIIKFALRGAKLPEPYPPQFLQKYGLLPINEAIRGIHLPKDMEEAFKSRDRLVFDELIVFNQTLELLDKEPKGKNGAKMKTAGLAASFEKLLPFAPTGAQKKVMGEISADLSGCSYMNRLVQGDVGSGKTILAFYAMFCALKNGYQSALMAPTEILAQQHFDAAKKLFHENEVSLILGSQTASQRRASINKIKDGTVKIIIGTHAVIYGKMEFHSLGLIITDEQHKFGVRQRAALAKGHDVHMLTMSATPIPRSLALVLYGKTDISIVDELPPGRQPINTYIIQNNKYNEMLQFIKNELSAGRQGYIVCPLIDEDESGELKSVLEILEELKTKFNGYKLALLHGKLKAAEKEKIMASFESGETQMIVSTTVIEVGIDVPNATVMCVLNAERFGLAQLHQLRGRVGRGKNKSYCFLVSDNKQAYERLSILCKTQDGFEIAKKDMELRGTGDLFGTRQHGENRLAVANVLYDAKILQFSKNVLEDIKNVPQFSDVYQFVCMAAQERAKNTIIEISFN